ncbi:ECF RNA polymerase sigma factor SigK [Pseudokineococcus sp. 1T1Z-3]|uniref:ECF RNA polymerase sigma factor SigK n=1 Tax=Pseudokineococcus sp. 1T1Z-3 TaxID=3132745 RepID=UPI00309944E5
MSTVSFLRPERRRSRSEEPEGSTDALGALLRRVARGDEQAFEALYDAVAGPVYGVVLRVLRDPAQSEEVTQEVMVEVWRQAPRYDAERGSARGWVLTVAHRRAVDRVRSAQASTDREDKVAARDHDRAFDVVAEEVEHRLEAERVRRSLDVLTDLQRESVELAYYGGYTHRQVAEILGIPLGTVKTRLRDGLIRLRDEMGVVA